MAAGPPPSVHFAVDSTAAYPWEAQQVVLSCELSGAPSPKEAGVLIRKQTENADFFGCRHNH